MSAAGRVAPATLLSCRLVLERWSGQDVETVELVRRVVHEVPPGQWFGALPELDEDVDEWLSVELWEESASRRWPLDERMVERDLADALVENRLDELIAAARTA